MTWAARAKVGDKVVCVHDADKLAVWLVFDGNLTTPTVGTVYTIREIYLGTRLEIGFTLVEIVNPVIKCVGPYCVEQRETGFDSRFFRPATDDTAGADCIRQLEHA